MRILRDGRAVELGPGRRRAIIAALLVDVGQLVLFETLVERVWDSSAPNKPMASIHTYVSRLRSAMRTVDPAGHDVPSPLLTETAGYRLAVDPMAVDSVRFERLLEDAERCRDQGSFRQGRELIGRALELWRGPAYMDVRAPFAEAEAERLNSARERAAELAITLDMLLGRDAAVLPRLEEMVAANPFRESLQGSLMLALYRTGRQADALGRYRLVRELLADELGIDPGQELRDLHERILAQDPDLDPIGAGAAAPVPAPAAGGETARDLEPDPVRQTGTAPVRAQLRMVGRQAELRRVQERVAEAWSDGAVLAVTVVGEAASARVGWRTKSPPGRAADRQWWLGGAAGTTTGRHRCGRGSSCWPPWPRPRRRRS
ncbi:BTAD domain-containing putative transcriptional regulator [uncultured Jatrophihabitans sp.]|uniref:AfsR/SARP family transcriptional regulator n=1 Tax=uncultured Jatrophihabitans sp. TaxID=1610747 RepID=UPI0035CAB125